MDVLINGLQLKKNSSGIGGLIREFLLPWMEFSQRKNAIVLSDNSPIPSTHQIVTIRSPFDYEQGIRRVFFQSFILGKKYCKNKILLTVDSKIPFLLPKSTFVLPIITDLALYRLPETYQWSRRTLWKLQYIFLKNRGNHFIAISHCTKEDMVELLGIPREKIDVIPCAASPLYEISYDSLYHASVQEKYNLPKEYILFVGNFNPRKNLERMLLAFDRLKEKGYIHKFVVIGENGWKFDKKSSLSQLKYKVDVIFLGYVPDEDMPSVYKNASSFLFATLYEGFGIPVIEAQHCGTPVIVSRNSAFPEIVSEQSAVFVNALDVDSILNAMIFILENPKQASQLVEAGYENAKRFSWKDSVRKLEETIERIDSK